MRVRIWVSAAVALCAGLLLCTQVSDLYAQANQAPTATTLRSMLKTSFRNVGIQGAFFNSGAGSGQYQSYPYNHGGGGSYGSNLLTGTGSSNSEAYQNSVRAGHGVWTMTSDAEVVYTGVRIGMQNEKITAMQYDVESDPGLSGLGKGGIGDWYFHRRPTVKLGNGSRYQDGFVESSMGGNWWPGGDLIVEGRKSQPLSKPPVHILNYQFSEYPRNDEWPEEIILTQWTNTQGITTSERAFMWSHPDFDDLIIDEYILENTGDTNGDGDPDMPVGQLNDLYIGFQDRYNISAAGQHAYIRYWRDERDWCMDDWYVYDPGNKVLYAWDGDHPLYRDWDDTGDPYKDAFATGTLANGGKIRQGEDTPMSPAHLGVGVVAYTDDPTSPYRYNAHDTGKDYVEPDGDQPYAVRFWESFNANVQNDPNNVEMTETEIYSDVLGGGRSIDANPDHPGGQFSMLIFGPYDVPPNGKIKIVLAYLAGHPGQMLGNTDVWTWGRADKPLATKQAELLRGKDALEANLEAARFAYQNAFDIPDAPPDVNFRSGSSPSASMTLDWPVSVENAAHPDYAGGEANDVAGYRIYRSTWFHQGPWELLADIPVGTTSREETNFEVSRGSDSKFGDLYLFEDKNSAAGFFFYYSVRPYSKPHTSWSPGGDMAMHPLGMADLPGQVITHVQVGQEGGWAANTQRIYAAESPFAIPSAGSENLQEQVLVVPNPYFLDESHQYPGSTKIRFVGVPSKSRIRVFSVSGELVSDFKHDDASKGETDYNQFTWNFGGEIATGVYFYVVENLTGSGEQFQRGTFMVLR